MTHVVFRSPQTSKPCCFLLNNLIDAATCLCAELKINTNTNSTGALTNLNIPLWFILHTVVDTPFHLALYADQQHNIMVWVWHGIWHPSYSVTLINYFASISCMVWVVFWVKEYVNAIAINGMLASYYINYYYQATSIYIDIN